MRDWHVKHMQETIIKYLTGLPENASRWQKKLNKKYGNLTQVTKRIQYDLKHGVERQEVVAFLTLIKIDQLYLELRNTSGFAYRLYHLEASLSMMIQKQIRLCHLLTIRFLDSENCKGFTNRMYVQDTKKYRHKLPE